MRMVDLSSILPKEPQMLTGRWLSLLAANMLLAGCHSDDASNRQATVFDKDERRPMPIKGAPFHLIGMVSLGGQKICSGAIVAPSVVLTSAHCLATHYKKTSDQVYFFLGYHKKTYRAVSIVEKIYVGSRFPLKDRSRDWAFLVLKKPLGHSYGTLNLMVLPNNKLKNLPVAHAGYSIDFLAKTGFASLETRCHITYGYNNLLRHNCDATAGSSGGPLWVYNNKKIYIVGIHVASAPCTRPDGTAYRCPQGVKYSHDIANYGVSAGSFYSSLKGLLQGQEDSLYKWP